MDFINQLAISYYDMLKVDYFFYLIISTIITVFICVFYSILYIVLSFYLRKQLFKNNILYIYINKWFI